MPAVALRRITFTGQDGKIYAALPGERIEGYDSWSYAVKKALREQEKLRDLDDHSLVLSSEGGRLHLAVYGEVTPEEAAQPLIVDSELVARTSYACEHCPHTFQTRGGLYKHVQKKHSGA